MLAILAGLPSMWGGFLEGDDRQLIFDFVNHPSMYHAFKLWTLEPHRYLYQPVPLLSFAAEFSVIRALGLTPLPDEPSLAGGLLHQNNVLIHALTAWLVWRLVARLHEDRRVAFVAAVLFAVHPLGVQPTAWLSGRIMQLSVMFCLAALFGRCWTGSNEYARYRSWGSAEYRISPARLFAGLSAMIHDLGLRLQFLRDSPHVTIPPALCRRGR